jgi:hypothetical protein
LRKCIRILIHWNTDKPAHEIQHVYIKGAANLRPDLSDLPPVDWEDCRAPGPKRPKCRFTFRRVVFS